MADDFLPGIYVNHRPGVTDSQIKQLDDLAVTQRRRAPNPFWAQNYLTNLARAAAKRATPDALFASLLALPTKGPKISIGEMQRRLAQTTVGLAARGLKALKENKAARVRTEVLHGRYARGARGFGSPDTLAAALIGDILADRYLERRQRLRILAVGRRGALATRPLPHPVTNRTGAASTRPLDQQPEPKPKRAAQPAAAPVGLPNQSTVVVSGESQRSKDARAIMEATRSLPAPRSVRSATSSKSSPLASLLSAFDPLNGVRSLLSTPMREARRAALPRAAARLAPGAARATSLLTGFVGGGVALPPNQCECARRKKPAKPRCTNPVISRETSGGIRTTKVRIQCPSSKQK